MGSERTAWPIRPVEIRGAAGAELEAGRGALQAQASTRLELLAEQELEERVRLGCHHVMRCVLGSCLARNLGRS